jgi:predicted nucleotidyltransferase
MSEHFEQPTAPQNMLLAGIVGSTAYGLATSDSDIDIAGVYAAPTVRWHGLRNPPESVVSRQGTKPDFVFHEIVKYLRMAMKCNPSIIELLWLDNHLIITPLGRELIDMRSMFLTRIKIRETYLGCARSQYEQLTKSGKPLTEQKAAKYARHIMRLLMQGIRLLETGELRVRLNDEEAEAVRYFAITAVRDPAMSAWVMNKYEDMFNAVYSPLPSQVNVRKVEEWLIKVRAHYLIHDDQTDFPWPQTAPCAPSETTFI